MKKFLMGLVGTGLVCVGFYICKGAVAAGICMIIFGVFWTLLSFNDEK